MNKFKNLLKMVGEIAALFLFLALLFAIFQAFVPGASPSGKPVTSTSARQEPVAYPPPGLIPSPIASPTAFKIVTPTHPPTWTPYPTNTARPGPTPTPIPLVGPAENAAGQILYVAVDDQGQRGFQALEVDEKGMSKAGPARLPSDLLPEGAYFPSPDGKYIVIISDSEGGIFGNVLEVSADKIAPLIGVEAFFNWYPDSKHVLVRKSDLGLYLVNVYGKEPAIPLVMPDLGDITAAASSPDGQKIIYSYWKGIDGQPAQIGMVNADGREAVEIMQTPYQPYNFTWSPDGSQIAFLGDGLMVMNPDGSGLRRLGYFPLPQYYYLTLLWSPDSQKLTLPIISEGSGPACHGWGKANFSDVNIIVINIATGKVHTFPVEKDSGNIDPAWSPDGKKIVFVSNRGGAPNLWAADADGANLYPLTTEDWMVRFPFWLRP